MKNDVLQQRRIEANIIQALYEELSREIGEERALTLIATAVGKQAFQKGRDLRTLHPSGDLSVLAELWRNLGDGGALDIEFIQQSADCLQFRVNRCGYAEAYAEMGISPRLGAVLSCSRDEALLRGFSEQISFECSRTIMDGSGFCQFTYRKQPLPSDDGNAVPPRND